MSETSAKRPRLSVAMIVRNAADSLAETLDSIVSLADEIVLLDTGSTDGTKQIAQQYELNWHEQPWQDSFSIARNRCLENVTGDWVLWLDAGERLSSEDAIELRDFLNTKADTDHAYMMMIKVPSAAGNIAGEQIGQVRLVPNRPGIKFTGRVREQLTNSLAENNIPIEGLLARILRGSRDNETDVKIRKAQRNIHLVGLEMKDSGELPHLLNALAEAHQVLGNKNGAIDFYQQSLGKSDRESPEMLEAFYGLLTAMDDEQDRQPQVAVCMEALAVYPMDAQLLCAMGGYLQGHNRLDLASRSYRLACSNGKSHPQVWNLDGIEEIAAACLSLALQLQGQDDEAQQVLEEALTKSPTSYRLRRHLLELHVKHGRRDEALAQLENFTAADVPHIEAMRSAIRGACLATQENWIVAKSYLQTAYDAGCRDAFCQRWLIVTLLSMGESEQALEVIEKWKSVDPSNPELNQLLAALSGPTEVEQSDVSRHLRVDTAGQEPASHSAAASAGSSQPTSS